MNRVSESTAQRLPTGVMLNAYPDSIGKRLSDTVALLKRPELKDAFSLLYILPTFFNSDLDRGFSVIDYDLNQEFVSPVDLKALNELGISIKLDLVLNHLSVHSPQFQDLLKKGQVSRYREFFIDWNVFWDGQGGETKNGALVPDRQFLDKLFMRKPELPVLRVCLPDGTRKSYWNTFYKKVTFNKIEAGDFLHLVGISPEQAATIAGLINRAIQVTDCLEDIDLGELRRYKDDVLKVICQKRDYLGQMDLNAQSEVVWEFYDETLRKLSEYGAKIVRLDAFAYLHKAPGEANFFNRPGTWEYLARLRAIAEKYGLIVFPEIHAEYGKRIHEEIAREGYPIYDFFFPGLVIDALDRGVNEALLRWIGDIQSKGLQTINMLGCHDGIPVLDLKGVLLNGAYAPGLLADAEVDAAVNRVLGRGGRVKNLFGADGSKIAYYQVNATFFSALGEDETKLLLARAIQMFMPGIPQVWYLDLFAGKNDYEAADNGGTAGHKEINRTNLTLEEVKSRLERAVVRDQIELIRLRNTSAAFKGQMEVIETDPDLLHIHWRHRESTATLKADLRSHGFTVLRGEGGGEEVVMSCGERPRQDAAARMGPAIHPGASRANTLDDA